MQYDLVIKNGYVIDGSGAARFPADIGIAGGNGRAIIFRKGVKTKVVPEAEMLTALMAEIQQIMAEQEAEGTTVAAS